MPGAPDPVSMLALSAASHAFASDSAPSTWSLPVLNTTRLARLAPTFMVNFVPYWTSLSS